MYLKEGGRYGAELGYCAGKQSKEESKGRNWSKVAAVTDQRKIFVCRARKCLQLIAEQYHKPTSKPYRFW
jgi:hypothetical protein